MKLYLHLDDGPRVNEETTWNEVLCGKIADIEQTHYSSSSSLVFEFHSDWRTGNNTGFRGTYRFLSKRKLYSQYSYFLSLSKFRLSTFSTQRIAAVCSHSVCYAFQLKILGSNSQLNSAKLMCVYWQPRVKEQTHRFLYTIRYSCEQVTGQCIRCSSYMCVCTVDTLF